MRSAVAKTESVPALSHVGPRARSLESAPARQGQDDDEAVRPFLKWVGGKRALLPVLRAHSPEKFARYHEPFVGGGAMFFHLSHSRLLRKGAVLSDNNERLVRAYKGVRDAVDRVIALLHDYPHDKDFYLRMRERYYGNEAELVYNCCAAGDAAYNVRFCNDAWMNVSNLEYCMFCGLGTKDSFGSIALKRRENCILNKQYSSEEYKSLRARLVTHMKETGEWGRFFPPRLSPNAYNRSAADFWFPLSKGEALKQGFTWDDDEETAPAGSKTPPSNIDEFTDAHLEQTYTCVETNKPFKILKREIEFYRALRIPPPNRAPLHRLRISARQLQVRPSVKANCANCSKTMLTVHNPAEHKIYCEQCYANEVF